LFCVEETQTCVQLKIIGVSNQVIVVAVAANPKPHDAVRRLSERQSAIVKSDPHRPEVTDFLEV
jgi:hypothetical protein